VFRVFKPQKRLKPADTYQTQPALAIELLRELKQRGFTIDVVRGSVVRRKWGLHNGVDDLADPQGNCI